MTGVLRGLVKANPDRLYCAPAGTVRMGLVAGEVAALTAPTGFVLRIVDTAKTAMFPPAPLGAIDFCTRRGAFGLVSRTTDAPDGYPFGFGSCRSKATSCNPS